MDLYLMEGMEKIIPTQKELEYIQSCMMGVCKHGVTPGSGMNLVLVLIAAIAVALWSVFLVSYFEGKNT